MSTLYLQYGTYAHDPGECEISRSIDVLLTDAQTPWAHHHRWTIQGQLVGDSANDLDAKVTLLTEAYAENNQDLSLKIDDENGLVTDATISIVNADTHGGIRVISGPSFPTMRNAAYVTHLNYQIEIEAIVTLDDPQTAYKSFSETIGRKGGGPRYGVLETATGYPVRQLLRRNTRYEVRQYGSAVGLYRRPTPPLPLWPGWIVESGEFESATPRRIGNDYIDFGVSWSYRFESAVPLAGGPTVWRR